MGLECSTRSVLLGPSEPLQPHSLLILFPLTVGWSWRPRLGLGLGLGFGLGPFFVKVGRTLACLDNREAGFSNVPSYHVKHKQQLRLKTPVHLSIWSDTKEKVKKISRNQTVSKVSNIAGCCHTFWSLEQEEAKQIGTKEGHLSETCSLCQLQHPLFPRKLTLTFHTQGKLCKMLF